MLSYLSLQHLVLSAHLIQQHHLLHLFGLSFFIRVLELNKQFLDFWMQFAIFTYQLVYSVHKLSELLVVEDVLDPLDSLQIFFDIWRKAFVLALNLTFEGLLLCAFGFVHGFFQFLELLLELLDLFEIYFAFGTFAGLP